MPRIVTLPARFEAPKVNAAQQPVNSRLVSSHLGIRERELRLSQDGPKWRPPSEPGVSTAAMAANRRPLPKARELGSGTIARQRVALGSNPVQRLVSWSFPFQWVPSMTKGKSLLTGRSGVAGVARECPGPFALFCARNRQTPRLEDPLAPRDAISSHRAS